MEDTEDTEEDRLGRLVVMPGWAYEGILEARRHVAMRETLLKVLDIRGLDATAEQRAEVEWTIIFARLERWFERALTATTADEVFID
jgi:hypothetical protein